MNPYEERKARKAERYQQYADNAATRRDQHWKAAHDLVKDIPLGQPILVGHHSEKRHRRVIDRSQAHGFAGVEEQERAAKWARRAAAVENDTSISRSDPEAIDKLREKVAELQAECDEVKRVNAAVRKSVKEHGADYGLPRADIPQTTKLSLAHSHAMQPYHRIAERGYPPYHLTNLRGNLRRYEGRLAQLEKRASTATETGYGRHMPNKWAGTCERCGGAVPALSGVAAQPAVGGWEVMCADCWTNLTPTP